MLNQLKQIYIKAKLLYNWFLNYYLPNKLKARRSKLVFFGKKPIFFQRVLITGKGVVSIGEKCVLGYKLGGYHYQGAIELQARYKNSRIEIGNNVATNNNLSIIAANKVSIGDNCLIGQNVSIMDHEAHGISPSKRREVGEIGTVVVGENVWIGNNVTILKNSIIGENSIVALGAVVTGEIPPNVIAGGIPAKVIKRL